MGAGRKRQQRQRAVADRGLQWQREVADSDRGMHAVLRSHSVHHSCTKAVVVVGMGEACHVKASQPPPST